MALGEGIEKLGLEEFQQGGFWKGELYIDNGKKIHKALDIKSVGILGTVKMLLTNQAVKDGWKKTKDTPGNIKGDGRFVTLWTVICCMDSKYHGVTSHSHLASVCGIKCSKL